MQIQFQGFHPYSVNNGSGWNMAAMQKKRQLLAEESAQKEQEALKTSISAEARSIWDQLENAEQSETDYTKQLLQVEDTLNEISHNLARTEATLEEKEEAATKFVSMARSSYSDLRELRATGLQQKQNAREIKLKYIGSQHLIAAQKAQEEMQAIATTSVIRQNLQEIVDKYGEQLKDKVKEKIDERNDIISNEKQEETILDELSLPEKEEEQEEKNDITK